MFLGEYQHTLDAKGRLILPSKFRARLEAGCVLTKGQDGCLRVFPRDEFERLASQLREAKLSNQQSRDFLRVFFSGASDEAPDRQGRVTIPEPLRRYAHLEREVTVIGVGVHFEIWDRAGWEPHQARSETAFSEMSETNSELPF